MSYKAGIVEAITELKDRNGSSMIAIKKVMQAKLPKDKKWLNKTFLAALKSGVTAGDFVQIKNSYKLSADFKKKATTKKAAPKKKPNSTTMSTLSKMNKNKKKEVAPTTSGISHPAILLYEINWHIFQFADLSDIPNVAAVCKTWKTALENVQETVFENIAKKQDPRLVELMPFMSPNLPPPSWKEMLQQRKVCKPGGVNRNLQKDLETVFRREGIIPYSNCCHDGCCGVYQDDGTFTPRTTDGIHFIRMHLNGMNYSHDFYGGTQVAAHYGSYEYLDAHWEEECNLLNRWCAVVGLKNEPGREAAYTIEKPPDVRRCVMITFHEDPGLECPFGDEEEDEFGDDDGDY